jgi:L-fucose mutarotase
MLKGISPLLSPDLISLLYRMGHGDEIVLADAHFPGETYAQRLLRADGLRIPGLLDAILPLFELDSYVDAPLIMMAARPGDDQNPEVEKVYRAAVDRHAPQTPPIVSIDALTFYNRAKTCFAVVMTGETAKYGNIILRKGVTPI